MELDRSLIKEFVEVTHSEGSDAKKEGTVYGEIVSFNNKPYVKIDGSSAITPAESTVEVDVGDRVMVTIKNHVATVIGNITDKSVGGISMVSKVDTIIADNGFIKQLSVDMLTADQAIMDHLTANYADINELNATYATIAHLNANYVNIDRSNIDKAWINELYATSGLIQETFTENATVTGYLNGVKIRGDLIEAETIIADKLMIQGEDGLYYKLNVDLGGATPGSGITEEDLQNGLHGTNIIANTITADKISVSDLTAFHAKLANFTIDIDEESGIGELYSGVKDSINNTTEGVYLSSDGQMSIGDSKNFLRYYKDAEGNGKLELSMTDNLIGAQNLLIESGQWTALPIYWRPTFNNAYPMALNYNRMYKGYPTLKIYLGNGNGGIVGNNDQWMELDPTKTYTYSALMFSDSNFDGANKDTGEPTPHVPLDFQVSSDGVNFTAEHTIIIVRANNKLTAGEWNFVHITFKVPEQARFVKFLVHGGTYTPLCIVNIAYLQLEEGTTPTAWRPASYNNFMTFDADGLQVGNHIGGTWTGYRTQTTGDSYNILDANGVVLATYGSDHIDLGVNSENSTINLCGNKGGISVTTWSDWATDADYDFLAIHSECVRIHSDYRSSLCTQYWDDNGKHRQGFIEIDKGDIRMYARGMDDEAQVGATTGFWNTSELRLTPETAWQNGDGEFYVLSDTVHNISRYGSKYEVVSGSLEFDAGSIVMKNSTFISSDGKTAWNDTKEGWYIGADGTAHMTNTDHGGYIGFHFQKSANATSSIQETSSGVLSINGMEYGVNQVLWSGWFYMHWPENGDQQQAKLASAISTQPHGVVLIFSAYDNVNNAPYDWGWSTHFIPKEMVNKNKASGQSFIMTSGGDFDQIGVKYLYVHDAYIGGNQKNTNAGTNNGITYNNSYFVLRYVIGV